MHVTYQVERHAPRGHCPQGTVQTWIPLPQERPHASRNSGHCPAQIPHGHIRQRLLLARAQRMPILHDAQEQYGFLEEQGEEEPGKGRIEHTESRVIVMERGHRLGMRTEAEEH